MELYLLKDIVVILGLSVAVLLLFQKLNLPSVIGYILTGVVAGPYALQLIDNVHEVEQIAEIGVIFLLFTIGIEFSLKKLLQLKRTVIIGGGLQLLLTGIVVTLFSYGFGFLWPTAIFMGFLFSLSSTAIVLKVLQDQADVNSPQGKVILSILIFQDLIFVPIILLTPLLADTGGENMGQQLALLLLKGIGIIAGVFVGAQWIFPNILHQIARTRSRELFIISILAICFCITWLTSLLGLSLALGAFLAGLIISESPFSYQAFSHILPFRDIFASFFFISIGMLLDLSFFRQYPLLIVGLTIGILLLKTLLCTLGVLILKTPLRIAVLTGIALSQVGEFSFILSKVGMEHELLTSMTYQTFLSVSILSMALTPLLIKLSPTLTNYLLHPLPQRYLRDVVPPVTSDFSDSDLNNHLVIIGYGINGRNLAWTAQHSDIPYIVIEMNPDTVVEEQQKGEPILYGDATYPHVLEQAHIEKARVVVIAISDAQATRRIIETLQADYPDLYIIVRTRYVNEVEPLYELGANEVIPEEFETSIEIFNRVLHQYFIPESEIDELTYQIRADGYEMLRSPPPSTSKLLSLQSNRKDVDIATYRVHEGAKVAHRPLGELRLRQNYKVNVLAVQRGQRVITDLDAETAVIPQDLVILFGTAETLQKVRPLFEQSQAQ